MIPITCSPLHTSTYASIRQLTQHTPVLIRITSSPTCTVSMPSKSYNILLLYYKLYITIILYIKCSPILHIIYYATWTVSMPSKSASSSTSVASFISGCIRQHTSAYVSILHMIYYINIYSIFYIINKVSLILHVIRLLSSQAAAVASIFVFLYQ